MTERGGTLMRLGGTGKGYKGSGLALMVDVLSQGLADFGREHPPAPMSLAVFVQVIDPDAFARHAGFTADACRAVPPAPGISEVRVPGDGAARCRRRALEAGVAIDPAVLAALAARAQSLGVAWPTAVPPPPGYDWQDCYQSQSGSTSARSRAGTGAPSPRSGDALHPPHPGT